MCKHQQPPSKSATTTRQRKSRLHFFNSFHGILGLSSLTTTIFAWIHNEYSNENETKLFLPIASVILTTVLSIHSSVAMLDKSPRHSTILDYQFPLRQIPFSGSKNVKKDDLIHIHVVAPHREAFHRTSLIMQYANSRILLLLHQQHGHHLTMRILLWALVAFACVRMLPISVAFFPRKKITLNTEKCKPIPFWTNGNTYCFVLPMMLSVLADFCMTVWCEYVYTTTNQPSTTLFEFHSHYWLSLRHLFFLQVVAHVIAFSFTVVFRVKHVNRPRKDDVGSSSFDGVSWILNIRTLYWTCTVGVYFIVVVGLIKAIDTINELG